MQGYSKYLQSIYSDRTFAQKTEYFRYNFGKYLERCKSVLEIGPGAGELVALLNSRRMENIDVFDIDRGTVDLIRKKYHTKNSFYGHSIKSVSRRLGKYDLIILTQVFEHIPAKEYKITLQTLYSHLIPGGNIIITVPNGGNPLSSVERYFDITHFSLFTENSLKQLPQYCGLRKCKAKVAAYKIPPVDMVNVLRIIAQKLLHTVIYVLIVVNGGMRCKLLTPNITLVITKD